MSSAANSDVICDKLARSAFETRKWQLFKTFVAVRLFSNFVCKGTGCGGKFIKARSLYSVPCKTSTGRRFVAATLVRKPDMLVIP